MKMMMGTKTATKPLVVVDGPPSTDPPGQCEFQNCVLEAFFIFNTICNVADPDSVLCNLIIGEFYFSQFYLWALPAPSTWAFIPHLIFLSMLHWENSPFDFVNVVPGGHRRSCCFPGNLSSSFSASTIPVCRTLCAQRQIRIAEFSAPSFLRAVIFTGESLSADLGSSVSMTEGGE